MIFAVASQNFRTVTGHAGKSRRFFLFEVAADGEPAEIDRLDLPRDMSFHEFQGGPHPLDRAQVILAGSAGAGFIRKMAERGITAVITPHSDPAEAVRRYLAEGAPAPDADADHAGGCGHCHCHEHGHA